MSGAWYCGKQLYVMYGLLCLTTASPPVLETSLALCSQLLKHLSCVCANLSYIPSSAEKGTC